MSIARDVLGHYTLNGPQTENDILEAAEDILRRKLERLGSVGNPIDSSDFLRMRLGALKAEQFHVMWLDNRHRILDVQKLFDGTVDGASVHPREVVRAALNVNASAAILAHNHPSGVPEPSAADRAITHELRDVLQLIGVRILDHIVVGATETVSMATGALICGPATQVTWPPSGRPFLLAISSPPPLPSTFWSTSLRSRAIQQ